MSEEREYDTTGLLGLTVLYRLSEADAESINDRRRWTAAPSLDGNRANGGELVPMVIVRAWSDECVNGHVLLDGNDSLWVTSVTKGDEPGQWQYR